MYIMLVARGLQGAHGPEALPAPRPNTHSNSNSP